MYHIHCIFMEERICGDVQFVSFEEQLHKEEPWTFFPTVLWTRQMCPRADIVIDILYVLEVQRYKKGQ